MEENEYLENIIQDKDIVKKIEDTTHIHYKKLFNWVKLMELYKQQLEQGESNYDLTSEIDEGYLPNEPISSVDSSITLTTKLKGLRSQINSEFEELYLFANDYNFYWCNSTLKTYEFYFRAFSSNFKRLTEVTEKYYFLVHEIDYFSDFAKNGFVIQPESTTNFVHRTGFIDSFSFIDFMPYLFDTNKLKIRIQNDKIIQFLLSEIEQEGYSYELVNNKYEFTHIKPLKGDLNISLEAKEPSSQNYPIDIFKNLTAFELFNYLDENYVDEFEKSKYVNLYRYFIEKGNVLICTQLKYIDFIKSTKDIKLSKITPPTYKYLDRINPKLIELNRLFDLNMDK
jgi:hypothetical protein